MKDSIFIPQRIKVGFCSRAGTYTGKLAYVIYFDDKNKLRKETSWDNWRDKKIDPEEYNNEPTEGFALNKKVGGYVGDWGSFRQSYVRVYDPRGFEIEITVPNLLYILEHSNSIKGKGLEGEFVYGWDGPDLVLIPTCSPDYGHLSELNNKRFYHDKISVKDLKIGATYLTDKNKEVVYMGRYDTYGCAYMFDGKIFNSFQQVRNYAKKTGKSLYDYDYYSRYQMHKPRYQYKDGQNIGKQHFFCYLNKDDGRVHFTAKKTISGMLIDTISELPISNFTELFDKLESQQIYSPYDPSADKYVPYTIEELRQKVDKLKAAGPFFSGFWANAFINGSNQEIYIQTRYDNTGALLGFFSETRNASDLFDVEEYEVEKPDGTKFIAKRKVCVSLERLLELCQFYFVEKYLKNGRLTRRDG